MKEKTKSIKQTVSFKATPSEVFEALMDSKKHSKFTGGKASISRKVGGKFSAYDGYAYGKNLEIVENKKIVQTWQASDWPEEIVSTVEFSLEKTKTGTKLTFIQKNVPADQLESVKDGWIEYYWKPMKVMLEK
jgi:activator of HSP90 ATPase